MEILLNEGKHYSLAHSFYYYARQGNIHIMDNHRGALWAWLQHIEKGEMYQFIHIDKHYDTSSGNLDTWIKSLPTNFSELSFEDLMNVTFDYDQFTKYKTISWDNYIPIFYHFYSNIISNTYFFTHNQGDLYSLIKPEEWGIIGLLEQLDYLILENKNNTILNLDLDYFFAETNQDSYNLFLSEDTVISLFEKIKQALDQQKIQVLTIALSPVCCGGYDVGWDNSLDLYHLIAPILGLDKIAI